MRDRKQYLMALQTDLHQRLENIATHQQHAAGPLAADFAEQAIESQNDEVIDQLEMELKRSLAQTEHALTRLNKGVGEVCEICDGSIEAARLSALPNTTLCADCASYKQ